MRELTYETGRKTQLIDITADVRDAVGEAAGSAVLVYVPHTTAGVTINERIDPVLVDAHLAADPLLQPLVTARPGLRAPGHPDGTELLVRAVLGQQVSVAGAWMARQMRSGVAGI